MTRTWIITEDIAERLEAYLKVLLSRPDICSQSDRVVALLHKDLDETQTRDALKQFLKGGDSSCDGDERVEFFPYKSFQDIESVFTEENNLTSNMLVLLDLELTDIVLPSNYEKEDSREVNLWRSLVTDPAAQNVISISSSKGSAQGTVERISGSGHSETRVFDNDTLRVNCNNAAAILEKAHGHWCKANGVGQELLEALLRAQKLIEPGHPSDCDWPDAAFPLIADIELDTHRYDAFKALFWYEAESACELKSSLFWVYKPRAIRSIEPSTVESVLKTCGVRCKAIGEVLGRITLPSTPGVLFLWRLAEFVRLGLHETVKPLTLGLEEGWVVIRVPLKDSWQFFGCFSTGCTQSGHGAVELFRRLLACPNLTEKDLRYLKSSYASEANKMSDWKQPNICEWYKPDGGKRRELMPLVCYEFSSDELLLSWPNRVEDQQTS